jgi:hypothetical protein
MPLAGPGEEVNVLTEKERTVRSALASWSRTARLCTIYIVSGCLPSIAAITTIVVSRH